MDLAQFWFQAAGGPGPTPPFQLGNSLRFRGAQSLSRVPASNGNRQTFTHSFWLKKIGVVGAITSAGSGAIFSTQQQSTQERFRTSNSEETGFSQIWNAGGRYQGIQGRYTDPGGWYHVVAAFDSTQAAAADRLKIYINGELKTRTSNADITQNQNWTWNSTLRHNIGKLNTNDGTPTWDSNFLQGYLAEYHMVDGTALEPGTFGEFNADGVWVPREVNLTQAEYGQNGFYLDFSGDGTGTISDTTIGLDKSGNGNNFTATGFELTDTTSTSYDWMADSPTNNYSTLNPLYQATSNSYYANANLFYGNSAPPTGWTAGTLASTGAWYAEAQVNSGNSLAAAVGIVEPDDLNVRSSALGIPATSWGFQKNGDIYNNSVRIRTGSGFNNTDIIGIACNPEAGTLEFFRNGTSVWSTNTIPNVPLTVGISQGDGTSGISAAMLINAGQQPFQHTPPAGFEPLSTAGLPNVAITNPSDHFQTILSDNPPNEPDPPAQPGEAYGGGFYVGRYRDANRVYNLIVAPKVSGNLRGESDGYIQYKTSNAVDTPYDVWENRVYGGDITTLMAARGSTFPAANWLCNDANGPNAGTFDITGNSNGTGIGGFNDWYMPTSKELQMIYHVLKPTTDEASSNRGEITWAVPPYGTYGQEGTVQTTVAAFQEGGAEAFQALNYNGAEQAATATHADQYKCAFGSGVTHINWGKVLKETYNRAVRREFAYDAGILDYAQMTFPNGLWWIKDRANSNANQFVDSLHPGRACVTPGKTEEDYVAPAGNSVAWCWSAPDAWSTNAGDNGSTIASSGRRNLAAGFSMVNWTGNGATSASLNHGLDQAPDFILTKNRSRYVDWMVTAPGCNGTLETYSFNQNYGASAAQSDRFPQLPDDNLIYIGNTTALNQDTESITAWCWHAVPGYSAFGEYTANGELDNSFCYTGHRPAFIMIKYRSGSISYQENANWYVIDCERGTYNPVGPYLQANSLEPELTNSSLLDILSNGFKIRNQGDGFGKSGVKYIWASFAEHPFGGGNVSPAPAR